MAITVRSAADSAAKWVRNSNAGAGDYSTRAQAAAGAYAAGAGAAEKTYQSGVTAPNTPKLYSMGIRRAGATGYAEGVREKGAARYGQGVNASQSKMEQRVAPYLATISSLTLPPRAPRGSESNNQRVSVITKALAARRLQGAAGG